MVLVPATSGPRSTREPETLSSMLLVPGVLVFPDARTHPYKY